MTTGIVEQMWDAIFPDPHAFFEGVIAMFTIVLGIGTLWLVRSTRDTATQELRAYIAATPNFIFNFSPTVAAQMQFAVSNHGQTPAYEVENSAVVDILPFPLPNGFVFPPIPPAVPRTYALQPTQTYDASITANRFFTVAEIAAAAANNGCRIYCFGIVRYRTFGDWHETRFCRSIIGTPNLLAVGSGGVPAKVDLGYEISPQHNDAD